MSTDQPIDQETAEKLEKAAALYDALEDADIDLDDLPQREGTSRRELLQAAGLIGGGAIIGGTGLNSMTGKAQGQAGGTIGDGNEDWNINSLDVQNGIDATGSDITNVGALDTDNADVDQLLGKDINSVLDVSQYADMQSALDALTNLQGMVWVPVDGFGQYGSATTSKAGLTIAGAGTGFSDGSRRGSIWQAGPTNGTVLDVDMSGIQSFGAVHLRDFTFAPSGNSGFEFIRLTDAPLCLIEHIHFEFGNNDGKAMVLTGTAGNGSFSTVVRDIHVRQPNETPIIVDSDGSLHKFEHSTIAGDKANNADCIEVQSTGGVNLEDTDLNGGRNGLLANDAGTIQLENARAENCETGFSFGESVSIDRVKGSCRSINTETTGVRINDVSETDLRIDKFQTSTGADLLSVGPNAGRVVVRGDRSTLDGRSVTVDSAAYQVALICEMPVNDTERSGLPVGTNYTTIAQISTDHNWSITTNPEGGTTWVTP